MGMQNQNESIYTLYNDMCIYSPLETVTIFLLHKLKFSGNTII